MELLKSDVKILCAALGYKAPIKDMKRVGSALVTDWSGGLMKDGQKIELVDTVISKMKHWALGKGYELRSSTRGIVDFYDARNKYEFTDSLSHLKEDEFEAVLLACNRILI